MPTASGDRKQDIPDWLRPFTEGLVEGERGEMRHCPPGRPASGRQ